MIGRTSFSLVACVFEFLIGQSENAVEIVFL
jgi:hypothetical protein